MELRPFWLLRSRCCLLRLAGGAFFFSGPLCLACEYSIIQLLSVFH
ncbi:hypothetical protein HMPREF0262_00297 [Clostridium sp. ATCC 29733]|nr:hypothetical protein HMPREF0262_00297 [Clostridium sp. ATCC 29733]